MLVNKQLGAYCKVLSLTFFFFSGNSFCFFARTISSQPESSIKFSCSHNGRNKINQSVPNEVYSSNLPHTVANTSNEQNASCLYGESKKSSSCEETLENCRDDKPILLNSSR